MLAAALLIKVFVLRQSKVNLAEAGEILFVLPVALLALEFHEPAALPERLISRLKSRIERARSGHPPPST